MAQDWLSECPNQKDSRCVSSYVRKVIGAQFSQSFHLVDMVRTKRSFETGIQVSITFQTKSLQETLTIIRVLFGSFSFVLR